MKISSIAGSARIGGIFILIDKHNSWLWPVYYNVPWLIAKEELTFQLFFFSLNIIELLYDM